MFRFKPFFLLLLGSLTVSYSAQATSSLQTKYTAKRVIALNWSSTEALLALDLIPVGVADPKGYATWVGDPELPDGIVNVGVRGEPNLEVMKALKPDLIISSQISDSDMDAMSNISSVLTLDTFRSDHNNGEAIDRDFLNIAKAVNQVEKAENYLRIRDDKIRAMKKKLKQHFSQGIPPVTLVHFVNISTAAVYGKNSSVEYALSKLGIQPALPTKNTAWGETNFPLQQLAKINSGVVIYIRPFPEEKKLFSSILWKHMPFVQNNHFLVVEPCWTYGSALSIEHIAKATTQALLTLPKQ